MSKFIVIDTETTWSNRVMSIGAVISDSDNMQPLDCKYYILDPEYKAGGMYAAVLLHRRAVKPIVCTRPEAMSDFKKCCSENDIHEIFAYNALFDKNNLPEISYMKWHDIMGMAAYAQYNPAIPKGAKLCSTGRLKSGYGVESMLRLLSGNNRYFETHNAVLDAIDELKIMMLLGHPIEKYRNI